MRMRLASFLPIIVIFIAGGQVFAASAHPHLEDLGGAVSALQSTILLVIGTPSTDPR